MSRWKSVVTNVGLNLLSNVTDSRAINIVAVKCGVGKAAENQLASQTELTGYKCDLQLTESRQTSDTNYRITARLANDEVSDSFNMTQVGVFATLGDSQNQVLFMIMQCTDDGDVIPAGSLSKGFTATYQINLAFSNTENVNVVVSPLVEGLATVATSGSYNDLTDTPVLASVSSTGNFNDLNKKPGGCAASATELVSLINDLPSEGGTIYLQAETYLFTGSDLQINKNNITLIGSGAGTILKFGAGTKLNVIGDYVEIKNLTLMRDEESTAELVLLDVSKDMSSKGFLMENVRIKCANTVSDYGTIWAASTNAEGVRLLGCDVDTGCEKLIYTGSTGTITGIINNCISGSEVTVPTTVGGVEVMILGVNINVKAGG